MTTEAEAAAAEARALEQARLRKERREAKIKAGATSRLNRITGLGGGLQRGRFIIPIQPFFPMALRNRPHHQTQLTHKSPLALRCPLGSRSNTVTSFLLASSYPSSPTNTTTTEASLTTTAAWRPRRSRHLTALLPAPDHTPDASPSLRGDPAARQHG